MTDPTSQKATESRGPSRAELIALGAILLYACATRVTLINRSFHRDSEGCGSFYGLLARNYFRYDWKATLGVPVMSMGIVDRPTFYHNHPPLVPLMIAGVFAVAGYTDYSNDFPPDWLVRLPTVPFTIGCILMIWMMLRRHSHRAALLAAAIFAAIPMTIVYGGLVDVISPQLVFFILLTVAAYLRFVEAPSLARFAIMLLAFLPAALIDWPAFFLVPVLCAHFMWVHPPRRWGWAVGLGSAGVMLFLVPYVQVVLVTDDWLWMKRLIERRALGSVTDADAAFTWADWFRDGLFGHATQRHTWPVMILGAMWLIWASARWRRPVSGVRVTGILLGWAILHIIIGRQGVFVHQWWWWPLTPGIAIAAGLMIDQIVRLIEQVGIFRRSQERQNVQPHGTFQHSQECWNVRSRMGWTGPAVLNAAVAVLLVIFAGWNTWRSFVELSHPARISMTKWDYSVVEIGQIIRESVPPDAVVMLAEGDQSLSLWYYADRPLRYQVWDAGALQQRLSDDSSDLCFGVSERHRGLALVFVLPKAYEPIVPKLSSFLYARYPSKDAGKFIVFALPQQRK